MGEKNMVNEQKREQVEAATDENQIKNISRRGPGRPTDKRKDTVLRLRVDRDTHRKVSECAARRNISMSEMIRLALWEIIEKDNQESENTGD
jgi:predicted HicB family RNase H-like nuclease